MKLFAVIFCVCAVQICSGSYSELNLNIQKIRNVVPDLNGINGRFEEDIFYIFYIFQRYPTQLYVNAILHQFMHELAEMSNDGNTKIDVNIVKEYSKHNALTVDDVKVLQGILLKKLRPEDINGIINLMYAIRPNATSDEIQSALDYLYGIKTEAPFIEIPAQTISDCLDSNDIPIYRRAIDDIKTIVDIKPKVILDFVAVFEKFPCNPFTPRFLQMFMEILIRFLKGNESKIDVCTVKNSDIARHWDTDAKEEMRETVAMCDMMGSILGTRLPEENFRGMVDFIEAFRPDTTYYGIKKRLKYLYVHVPRPTKLCNGDQVPTLISNRLPDDMLD